MTTPGTPEQRLAEAMPSEFPDAYGTAYRHWAEFALYAIRADPSILAPLGIGRLPTRSQLMQLLDGFDHVQVGMIVPRLIAAGFAREDQEDDVRTVTARIREVKGESVPDPPQPEELPTVAVNESLLNLAITACEVAGIHCDQNGYEHNWNDVRQQIGDCILAAAAGGKHE